MTYNRDFGKVFWFGLTVMFTLMGIAAILNLTFNFRTFWDSYNGWIGMAGSVVGMLIDLFFLFIFMRASIWFASSIGWISRASRYSGHNLRWWAHDCASEVWWESYAKGEISKEEYDRMRGV